METYTQAEAGRILGISRQRVNQLLREMHIDTIDDRAIIRMQQRNRVNFGRRGKPLDMYTETV